MQYREIGSTGIQVSEISLGCWTMGGLNWVDGQPNGWANVDEDDIVKAVKTGLDAGVNHFDNADVYGNGRAERMLARVLKKLGVDSSGLVIATKTGHFKGTAGHAYEPTHIRHQIEQSLINLQRDYVDIYYFHHGNFGENDAYLEGAAETMDALVKEGKVRIKGQSAYSAEDFRKTVPVVKPAVLQSWAHLMDTQFIAEGSPVARLMEEHDLSFVAFSPLGQGILLNKYDPKQPPTFEPGDYRAGSARFTAKGLEAIQPGLKIMKERFGADAETLASVALRYVLDHPRVACVIPGFRNEKQVKCNLAAAGFSLTDEDRKLLTGAFAEV